MCCSRPLPTRSSWWMRTAGSCWRTRPASSSSGTRPARFGDGRWRSSFRSGIRATRRCGPSTSGTPARGPWDWASRSPRAMPTGAEIPVDISLSPIEVGGHRLAAAALRDLRGRAENPDALRIQATALHSAANGIVITDATGRIVWVNPAACAITGYAADELVGAHTRILKSGEHGPGFYTDLWRSVTGGETWSGTIVNRRKDGTLYHEEQTIAPVLDAGGQVTHFVGDQGRCERPARSRRGPRHCESGACGAGRRDRIAQRATSRAGDPRPSDRPPQPPVLRRRPPGATRPAPPALASRSRSSLSISITSRRSTTGSGTPRATSSSKCSRRS